MKSFKILLIIALCFSYSNMYGQVADSSLRMSTKMSLESGNNLFSLLGSQSNPYAQLYVTDFLKVGKNSLYLGTNSTGVAGIGEYIYTTSYPLMINGQQMLNVGNIQNTFLNPDGGKVGIGTSIATTALHIHDETIVPGPPGQPSVTEAALHLTNQQTGVNANDGLKIYVQGNAGYISILENSILHFRTNGQTQVSIKENGDTWFKGNIYNASSLPTFSIFANSNLLNGASIQMNNSTTTEPGSIKISAGPGSGQNAGNIDLISLPTGKVRILEGIDNMSFDVSSDGNFYLDFHSPSPGANQRLHIGTSDYTNPENVLDAVIIGTQAGSNNGFKTDLNVFGTIKSCNMITQEIEVLEMGWCDYVFDSSYHLMSIKDLQNFINKHGHLPNIPSEKEIDQNGRKIGDMQKRQMEKIEELTLYVIQLSEIVEQLESKLNEIEQP